MESSLVNAYWVLVAAGFVLLGAEILLPGAIIGAMGVVALVVAAILGFAAFGVKGGFISFMGLLIGGAVFLYLWIKYCPQSIFGKWFTLQEDGKDFKSFDETRSTLVGKTGTAHSDLRPAGIAMIDGARIDVVSEAGFIPHGSAVKVIEVAGSRVVVRQVEAS